VSIELPPFPLVEAATLQEIASRHGERDVHRLPQLGMFNAVYALGQNLILRVPRNHPDFVAATAREAVASPLAKKVGVRTPTLVDYDHSLSLLPVPFLVYERVHGETLELLGLEPEATPEVWRELGRDYAKLHQSVARTAENTHLEAPPFEPPQPLVERLAARGTFTSREATWLLGMLERLEPAMRLGASKVFCHGDSQGTNVMVSTTAHRYLALIDWGSATWADPAHEPAGLPLRALPYLLEGYRQVAPMAGDDTAEARILWWQFRNALTCLERPPPPDLPTLSWAERPLSQLLEIMRFLMSPEGWPWLRFVR
jgi:aminoglycoside phosphotransferase (APT) family kinase protein